METIATRIKAEAGAVKLFDGRKKVGEFTPATKVREEVLAGIVAAFDDLPMSVEEIIERLTKAVEEALTRKGSVIPDTYRHQYGVDQNCGDAMAQALKEFVGGGIADDLDLQKLEMVAQQNGISDRFDTWLAKGLNNGMLRMNTGNVLRGKLRRAEPVIVGPQTFGA